MSWFRWQTYKIFGWIIIIVAVGLLSLPHIVPLLAPGPEQLKQWAVRTLAYPLEFKKVSLEWENMSPVVTLHEVEVFNRERRSIALQAQKIKLNVNLKDILLRHLRLKKLIIEGANIGVEYHDGHFNIAGLPDWGWDFSPQQTQPLSMTKQIIVENSNLHLMLSGLSLPFTDLTLWIDTKRQAKIRGSAKLLGLVGAQLDFGLDFPHKKAGEIQLYAHWQGAELEQLGYLIPAPWPRLQQGFLNVELWSQIKNPREINTQAQIELQEIKGLNREDQLFELAHIKGEIQASYKNKDWQIAGYQWQIKDTPSSKAPLFDFKVKSCLNMEQSCWKFKGISLPATQLLGWMNKLNFLQEADWLKNIQAKGNLDYLKLKVTQKGSKWTLAKAKAAFTDLDLNIKNPQLQLNSISGGIKFVDKSAKVILYSKNLNLHYPHWFTQPLNLDDTKLSLDWETLPESRIIKAKWETALFSGSGNIHYFENKKWPVVDVILNAQSMSFSQALNFLPRNYLSQELVNWLDGALTGELLGASMVLRGALENFPFDNKEGLFEVIAKVKNTELNYASGWPHLKNVSANLRFINRAMVIKEGQGQIAGQAFEQGEAIIADLGAKQPLLNVDAKISTRLEQGLKAIQKTPLQDLFAKVFAPLKLAGNMSLVLGLDIPISEHLADLKVRGLLELRDTFASIPQWALSFNKLSGAISFTQDQIKTDNLTGQLFDQNVQLQISSDLKAEQQEYDVWITGGLGLASLQKWLKLKPLSQISGHTDYRAHLRANPHTRGLTLNLNSSLMGVAIDAPVGLAKTAEEARPLVLKFYQDPHFHARLSAKYGDNVNATLSAALHQQQWKPLGAHIHFGEKRNAQFRADHLLLVDGEIAEVEVKKWQEFFQLIGLLDPIRSSDWDLEPLVELSVANLQVWGIPFAHTKVEMRVEAPWHWYVNFNGRALKGKLDLPLADKTSLIAADFHKLILPKKIETTYELTQQMTNPQHPIEIKIDHLGLGKKKLKAVQAHLMPSLTGYHLPRVQARLKDSQLALNGEWNFVNMPSQVQVRGKMETQNAGHLFNALGMAQAIQGAKGLMNFQLQWQGMPIQLNMATLGGQAEFSLQQGYMKGVNPGLSRILNLLNIDNMQRRLNLDFSDVTKNSFAFDELKGTLQFSAGKMTANRIHMVGPSAKIAAAGQVNLATHALNGEMTVMPNVTGSLPVAAAIAAGHPAVGAAVWMVDKMFKHKIQQINRINYEISGTWQAPLVQEASVLKE